MNLGPFVPLFVATILFLLAHFSWGEKHVIRDGNLVFAYPKAVEYIFLVVALAWLSMPWLAPLIRKSGTHSDDASTLISIAAVGASLSMLAFSWAKRYRVIVGNEAITSGAFFVTKIMYGNITRVKYLVPARYTVYSGSWKNISVWNSIADFPSFVNEISHRLPQGVTVERIGRYARYGN